MSGKEQKKKISQMSKKELQAELKKPWISMGTGVKIVAGASIVMAVLTAWQVIPSLGWLEGILWGLLFGALIWVIFFGNIWLNKLFRRK